MSTPDQEVDDKGRQKVQCNECKKWYHRLDVHVGAQHSMTIESYTAKWPGAEVLSATAKKQEAAKVAPPVAKEAMDKGGAPKGKAKPEAEPDEVYKIGVARLVKQKKASPFVPEHDSEWQMGAVEKEQLEALAMGIQAKEPVLIVGPTGCGKSTLVTQLAAACNQSLRRMNLHGDIRAADFLGDKTVSVDVDSGQAVVKWVDGILVDAMRKGHWLLLDELDGAPAHILFVIQAVLERGHTLVLSANNGEVVKAHPDFRFIATANTLGRGEGSELYSGTNMLNEAFLDRFGLVIQADYPDEMTEAAILHAKTRLNKDDCARMVDIARKVRKARETDTVYCTLSTRRLVAWADKATRFGTPKKAAKYVILNRLSTEDSKFVSGLIQRVWGS